MGFPKVNEKDFNNKLGVVGDGLPLNDQSIVEPSSCGKIKRGSFKTTPLLGTALLPIIGP